MDTPFVEQGETSKREFSLARYLRLIPFISTFFDDENSEIRGRNMRIFGNKGDHAGLDEISPYPSSRTRIVFATAAGILLIALVLFAILSAAFSDARLSEARSMCLALRPLETDNNRLGPWVIWLHAVSRVYIRYDKEQLSHRDPILACAAAGWSRACVRRAFRSAGGADAAGSARVLRAIRRARASLDEQYLAGAAALAPPADQPLRVPAGLGLAYQARLAQARADTCRLPPRDAACESLQRLRLRAVRTLQAILSRAAARALPPPPTLPGGGSDAAVAAARGSALAAAAWRSRGELEGAARLVAAQKVPGRLSREAWRSLDALSAVVWKRALAAAQAPPDPAARPDSGEPARDGGEEGAEGVGAAGRQDLLLDGEGRLQFVGGFRDGRFHGPGVLFRPGGGGVAYAGEWRAGRMDGLGAMFRPDGPDGGAGEGPAEWARRVVWAGRFRAGMPDPSWRAS